jgi:hypothetical protein
MPAWMRTLSLAPLWRPGSARRAGIGRRANIKAE